MLASHANLSLYRFLYSYWTASDFAAGPLRFVLMHVSADPAGVLEDKADCHTLASARCVLRSGAVYAVSLQGPRDALAGACRVLAQALPQHGYDESFFADIDGEIASALREAGFGAVCARLERNALVRPRPALAASQVEWLLLAVANRTRAARGEEPLAPLGHARRSPSDGGRDGEDAAISAYESVLDASTRTYQASARVVCGVVLDRLAVYNFVAARAGRSHYRAQALHALPWLLPMLAAPERGRILREVVTIRAAIDEALPLHEAVAGAFDASREVVRWLGRRPLPATWELNDVRLSRLLAALSWVPPERRPASCSQFEDLVQLCTTLARIFRFHDYGDLRTPAWSARHGPCMRRWLAECRQPGRMQDVIRCDPHRFAAECGAISDFLGTLIEAAEDRHGTENEAAVACAMRWAAGISLRRLLELSRRWHADAVHAAPPPVDESDAMNWPAVLPEAMQFGDRTVVELTDSWQLAVEGRLMRHCVAMYDQACYRGHTVIVSLRTASGAVRSTAELRVLESGGMRVAVEQHRSAENGAPDSACLRALEMLVRHLNAGDAEPLLRARSLFQHQHREQQQREERVRRGQAHEAAWRLAGSGLDQFKA
jgi:hypothetical protein